MGQRLMRQAVRGRPYALCDRAAIQGRSPVCCSGRIRDREAGAEARPGGVG